jgi:hypothetical protein
VSTILKALRRLEEEKASAGSRPLREEVAMASGPAPAPSPRRRWVLAAAPLCVLFLLAAIWSLWPAGHPDAASDVAAQPVATPAAAPEAVARAPRRPERVVRPAPEPARFPLEPRTSPSDAGLPDIAFASPVEVVDRGPVEPRTPIALARASDPLPEPHSAPAPEETPTPPAPEPVVAKPAPPAPDRAVKPAAVPLVARSTPPAPEPAVAKPAAPKPAEVAAVPASQPAARAKSAGPAPRVERTRWHPVAERRVAFVTLGDEALRIQEGDEFGRYVVREIEPSGVVFLEDGKPLRRKVGEN